MVDYVKVKLFLKENSDYFPRSTLIRSRKEHFTSGEKRALSRMLNRFNNELRYQPKPINYRDKIREINKTLPKGEKLRYRNNTAYKAKVSKLYNKIKKSREIFKNGVKYTAICEGKINKLKSFVKDLRKMSYEKGILGFTIGDITFNSLSLGNYKWRKVNSIFDWNYLISDFENKFSFNNLVDSFNYEVSSYSGLSKLSKKLHKKYLPIYLVKVEQGN